MVVDIPDVITSANFGEDVLRVLGVAGGPNLPFSIDFDRRPYNTVALPCECVMTARVSSNARTAVAATLTSAKTARNGYLKNGSSK